MNQYYKVYAGNVEKNQPSIWDRSRVQKINSKEEMDAYLKECNDVYTTFIREKIAEQDSVPKVTEMPKKSLKVIEKGDKKIQYERHHIIPRSLGGPDEEWNLVVLTYEDHFTAHKLNFVMKLIISSTLMAYF